jgi:hypothetical protein
LTGSRRTIRPKVNLVQQAMHGTSIIPSKNDGRKVMKMTNLFSYNILTFVLAWPNSLKSFISAPVRLIGKRGLICDHRNIGLKNLDEFVYFWKIFVYF